MYSLRFFWPVLFFSVTHKEAKKADKKLTFLMRTHDKKKRWLIIMNRITRDFKPMTAISICYRAALE